MMIGIFDMSRELKDLLKSRPCALPCFEGLQDKAGEYDRTYSPEMKRFKAIFGWASNEILKPVAVVADDGIERGRGHVCRFSGFQASVVSGRFDDAEASLAAADLAREREQNGCKAILEAMQDKGFISGILKAHLSAKQALLARGFDAHDGELKSRMMRSVHLPDEKGAGLPNLLRVVVSHGALAVAVWWSIVERTDVRTQFLAVSDEAGKLADMYNNKPMED